MNETRDACVGASVSGAGTIFGQGGGQKINNKSFILPYTLQSICITRNIQWE